MSEVKYSLNDKLFKDFGVYVSESTGLVGLLERKDVTQYDWSEYHGISPNLKKPKYKERTIELKCFMKGGNWEDLFKNFMDYIIGEFSKPGTQRLHIEPLGFKTLPYEVFMKDEVKVDKTFKEGEMFAVFTLKFIEPNPIKTILTTSLDEFKLVYKIDSETEIFFGDGTKQIGRGDVSLTKNYAYPSYQSSGITLVERSGVNNEYFETYSDLNSTETYMFSVDVTIAAPKNLILYVVGRNLDNSYEVVAISDIQECNSGLNNISLIKSPSLLNYGKFIFKVLDDQGNEVPNLIYANPRIETTEILGEWKDMMGKEKIIIIAGNIDDLKSLTTPAEILWNKI